MQTFEQTLESKHTRRLRNEDKAWDQLCRRSDDAEKMIGQIVRNGQIVFYVWPQGGKYREGGRFELINFLLRNHYA